MNPADFDDSSTQKRRDFNALKTCGIEEFQIENTSRCNFKCFMCYRKGLGKDMDESLVKMIVNRFPAIKHTTINGLGEPLLSHNIIKFVTEAKKYNHYVFIPTNGLALTEDNVKALVDSQVDSINVSIDATTSSDFKEIHGVDALEKVLSNTRMLVQYRNNAGSRKPRLSFCVVMTRKNVQQLPDLVRLGNDVGLDRVSFINLTPCRVENLQEILYSFPGRQLPDEIRQTRDDSLKKARKLGNEIGIKVEVGGFVFNEAHVKYCSDNLGRKLYISAEGEVSVCPILATETPRLGYGGLTRPARYVFGSLQDTSFEKILNSDSFRSYQSCVKAGKVPEFCVGCNWIHGL